MGSFCPASLSLQDLTDRGEPDCRAWVRKSSTKEPVFQPSVVLARRPGHDLATPERRPANATPLLVTYSLVHTATIGTLVAAELELLATFRRPHFTIRLHTDSDQEASRLLDALGPTEENPYNREVQQRRGPGPR
jgi:hypothetical protein